VFPLNAEIAHSIDHDPTQCSASDLRIISVPLEC
jgi:hypothetical protein